VTPARALGILAACVVAAGAGCAPQATGPGVNYTLSSRRDLHRIHRVVLTELSCDDGGVSVGRGMTESLFRALQATRLFHVDVIDGADPVCRDLSLAKLEPYTIQELADMRRTLKCDAVLLGRINSYQSYPHMQIGLYLRLLDLRDGKLVWAVDDVWDTTDKAVEARIQRFFAARIRTGYEPEQWSVVLKSPRAFRKFVACEIAETISPLPAGGAGYSDFGAETLGRIAENAENF